MMRKLKISWIVLLCAIAVQLQAQTNGYKFKRAVTGISKTWHIAELPDELFAHAKPGFEDLRIFGIKGKDTAEVPYLIKQRSDQVSRKEVPFAQINQSSGDNGYYYTFQSPGKDPPVINQIRLDFRQENFDWKVLLEGSNDNSTWFTILKDYRILSIKNSNTDYQFTVVNFPDSKYQYFRISLKSQLKPDLVSAKIAKTDTIKGIYKEVKLRAMQVKNNRQTKESTIDLALNGLVPVSTVKLNIRSAFDFYRTFRIEYATDSFQTDKGMQYNYADLYTGTLTSLEQTEFDFPNTLAARLRIVIENNDNTPLQIGPVQLKGNTFDLIARFDDPTYSYAMYYGNEKASAPSYEIGKFEDKIPDVLNPATIQKEETNPAFQSGTGKPLFENKIWLWALMTIIIIILGGFSYKMLKG
jgi:hypothetical protein